MSTVSYTRRLNTGAYEHAEATWSMNPAEHGLNHDDAATEVRRLVHLTLGIAFGSNSEPSAAPGSTSSPPAMPAITTRSGTELIVPATIAPVPTAAPASASIPPTIAAPSASAPPPGATSVPTMAIVPPAAATSAPKPEIVIPAGPAPGTDILTMDAASFRRKYIGPNVERLNKLRGPGWGGILINDLVGTFVKPPLGADAIPAEQRAAFVAKMEALQ
jgi:hypothetical protein